MIRFRRRSFNGDYANVTPKWHVQAGDYPGDWGRFVALCGYARTNLLGELLISHDHNAPRSSLCRRCAAKLPPAAPDP